MKSVVLLCGNLEMWSSRSRTNSHDPQRDSTDSGSSAGTANSGAASGSGSLPRTGFVPAGGVRVLPPSATAPVSSSSEGLPYDRLSQPEPSHEDSPPPYAILASSANHPSGQHASSAPVNPAHQGVPRQGLETSYTSPSGSYFGAGGPMARFSNVPSPASASDPLPAIQGHFLPRTWVHFNRNS